MNYSNKKVLTGKRIFVVEDDIVNAFLLRKYLVKHGSFVSEDILGYGIVQHIVESLPIDLILLDIQLKQGNNGYEIFKDLKNNNQLKNIPVVVITSYDPEIHIPIAKDMGFAGFISKPINAIELPYHLARILAGEKIWLISR